MCSKALIRLFCHPPLEGGAYPLCHQRVGRGDGEGGRRCVGVTQRRLGWLTCIRGFRLRQQHVTCSAADIPERFVVCCCACTCVCTFFVFFVSIPKSSTAALHGNMAVAELVMDRMTLPLDHQDACGQTALHNAIAGGNPRMVELLLAKGASVWLTDKVGHTAGQFLK